MSLLYQLCGKFSHWNFLRSNDKKVRWRNAWFDRELQNCEKSLIKSKFIKNNAENFPWWKFIYLHLVIPDALKQENCRIFSNFSGFDTMSLRKNLQKQINIFFREKSAGQSILPIDKQIFRLRRIFHWFNFTDRKTFYRQEELI